jgi:hypothetical protein
MKPPSFIFLSFCFSIMFITQTLEVIQLGTCRRTTESEMLMYLCIKTLTLVTDSRNGARKFHKQTSKTVDTQSKRTTVELGLRYLAAEQR